MIGIKFTIEKLFLSLCFFVLMGRALVAETVIQKEEIDYKKCLNVIAVSAEKLDLEPKITVDKEKLRAVEFEMIDGLLIIKCDGSKNEIIVSNAQKN